jgi:O-antigen ligase
MQIGTWTELRHVIGRLVFFIFILTTHFVVNNQIKYIRVLRLLLVTVSILAMFTIICAIFNVNPFGAHASRNPRVFWSITMPTYRAIGIPMSYGEYGLIINSVLPLFIISLMRNNFIVRRFSAMAGIIILFLALMITQSRNSWLATLIVIIFLIIFIICRRSNPYLKGATIFWGISTVIIVMVFLSNAFLFVYEGFALGKHASTFVNRLNTNTVAYEVFLEHWLFGAGHNKVSEQIENQLGLNVVIHNGYLDQLASTGIFGFLPFILLLFLSFSILIKISLTGSTFWRPYALCLAASFAANMSVLLAYKGFFSETFAIEYGLMLSLLKLNRKEQDKEYSNLKAF